MKRPKRPDAETKAADGHHGLRDGKLTFDGIPQENGKYIKSVLKRVFTKNNSELTKEAKDICTKNWLCAQLSIYDIFEILKDDYGIHRHSSVEKLRNLLRNAADDKLVSSSLRVNTWHPYVRITDD
jgi:hypothetical protein